jgi:hypothetical protein
MGKWRQRQDASLCFFACFFALVFSPENRMIRGMRKEMRRILWRLKNVKGLSTEEKLLFARSLAATPDERWRLHENFLRSHGLFTRSGRKAFGFK